MMALLCISIFLRGTTGQTLPMKETQLMEKQLRCALDKGPCDSFGEYIKRKYLKIEFKYLYKVMICKIINICKVI